MPLLFCLIIAGCDSRNAQEPSVDRKIGVMVSIEPVAAFVEAVGGQRVEVTVNGSDGSASPHTYEPKPEPA